MTIDIQMFRKDLETFLRTYGGSATGITVQFDSSGLYRIQIEAILGDQVVDVRRVKSERPSAKYEIIRRERSNG